MVVPNQILLTQSWLYIPLRNEELYPRLCMVISSIDFPRSKAVSLYVPQPTLSLCEA